MAELKKDNNYQDLLSEIIQDIKFGNVVLIIQDGKVIQIDKTEKIRL